MDQDPWSETGGERKSHGERPNSMNASSEIATKNNNPLGKV